MCTYLAQRGSIYYFRRAIPAELRAALGGKAEFMLSLRTKDRAEAKRRIPAQTIATDRMLDDARRQHAQNPAAVPSQRSSDRAAAIAHAQLVAAQEAAAWAGQEQDEKDERRAEVAHLVEYLKSAMKGSTRDMPPHLRAVAYLFEEGAFDRTLLRDQLSISRSQLRTLDSVAEHAPASAAPPAPVASQRAGNGSSAGVMLDTTVTDRWAAERRVAKKGEDAHRAVARWFYDRVERKPVDQITKRDVLAFKDALVSEGQSLANVKVKLSRLRTLLQWASANELAAENVAAGVEVRDTDKARNKRLPFDLASLNRIFSSPIYSEGARPMQGKGEAAYWVPLLALFTGARMEELGQLRPGDVQEVSYPDADGNPARSWFIRIREDAADNLKLKNAGSERDVPVHPELERLGFIAFVQTAQKAKQERLFPRLRPNTYGRLTAKWGEWFNPYMREVCGITDRRMVFHSFRHTFKDYARHSGMGEGIQRQIMGHSSGDVADQYGSGYPLHQVVAGMAAYKVPGLTLR